MNKIDALAAKLRAAFACYEGDLETLVPWNQADPKKRQAWRAIARAAQDHFA